MNILTFIGRGEGLGRFFPQVLIFYFLPKIVQIFAIFLEFAQIFAIFPQILANFDNFYQKRGETFSKIFHKWGKMKFFGRIFTYEAGSRLQKLNFSSAAS